MQGLQHPLHALLASHGQTMAYGPAQQDAVRTKGKRLQQHVFSVMNDISLECDSLQASMARAGYSLPQRQLRAAISQGSLLCMLYVHAHALR